MDINSKVIPLVTRQIQIEEYSSRVYLHLSNWAGYNGFKLAQDYLYKKAKEEELHRDKLFKFLLDCDYNVPLSDIKKPDMEVTSLENVIELSLEHEQFVSKSIFEVISTAYAENDWNSVEIFSWFVAEQREEESVWIDKRDYAKRLGLFDTITPEYLKGQLRSELEEMFK